MKMESRIRILAGTFVLTGVALSQIHNQWWLLLTAFVGVNLIQSAITGFCPAEMILSRIFKDSAARQA
ncbi:MAG TPA: DUF2892 domain-containing protein [Opitutaceae bacterium]|nr:DUF2892 domain-containing protein [Opitutaceae bacterium]